jgi:hypothetical protein
MLALLPFSADKVTVKRLWRTVNDEGLPWGPGLDADQMQCIATTRADSPDSQNSGYIGEVGLRSAAREATLEAEEKIKELQKAINILDQDYQDVMKLLGKMQKEAVEARELVIQAQAKYSNLMRKPLSES